MNEALSKCFGGLDIQSYFKHFAQQTILKKIFSKQFRSSFLDVQKVAMSIRQILVWVSYAIAHFNTASIWIVFQSSTSFENCLIPKGC